MATKYRMVKLDDIKLLRDANKKIVGYLGGGTFGIVYTKDLPGYGEVAVKRVQSNDVLKTELDRESTLTENFNHPNVLKLLFVREDNDFMYLVLEKCEGTLQQYFDTLKAGSSQEIEDDNHKNKYQGPKPPNDVEALRQLASGLIYIHNQKFVHRDLKSDNILISSFGDLKISDFGFCKPTNGSGSFSIGRSKQKINNVTSAPELLQGRARAERANQKCDIFSLGCVFFTFLTRGSHLFQETDDQNAHIIPTNILKGHYWLKGRLEENQIFAEPIISGMVESDPNDRSELKNILIELETHRL